MTSVKITEAQRRARGCPIIFSGPMVCALLDGRKTMTRRLAWREPRDPTTGRIADSYQSLSPWQKVKPGDLLWVRESFALPYRRTENSTGAIYRSDGPEFNSLAEAVHTWGAEAKWTSSIHMPRWASRLTLEVTATKIEQLQDISRDDEIAEGTPEGMFFDAVWSSLHGHESWAANPEVVAIAFKVHRANIDALSLANAEPET